MPIALRRDDRPHLDDQAEGGGRAEPAAMTATDADLVSAVEKEANIGRFDAESCLVARNDACQASG
jgi:hypothetical protein